MSDRAMQRLAGLLFFASGFAALLYQVIWQRMLGIVSGMHIYSITLIVTAFMAGLGFGSLAGGRLADRLTRRRAVGAFALCELAIGIFALISPWLYYDIAYLRLGFLIRYPLSMPLVHFSLLLVPTFLMGASLPLLARALVRGTAGAARTIGLLYGLNTLGAAAGALASAWYLIGKVGFVGTIDLGAGLNLLVAAGAAWAGTRWLSRGEVPDRPTLAEAPEAPAATANRSSGLLSWCLIYGLSGFVALSLELVWFRVLDVSIKSSPYTFGHLLGIFLAFLALGSLAGSRWVSRWPRADLVFFAGQWGVTASAGLVLAGLLYLPLQRLGLGTLQDYWAEQTGLEMFQLAELLGKTLQVYLVLPLLLVALPTFLMGVTFACIQRAVQTDPRHVGFRVGAIQTSNIVGSILGSLLTGALFLDRLGTARTASLLLAAGGVFSLLAWSRLPRGSALQWPCAGATALSLLLAFAVPDNASFWARFHGAEDRQRIAVAEDASGVAALQVLHRSFAAIRVNGKMHSMLPYGDEHTLLGIVPALLHPRIERALVIGLGSGNTAWAVGAAPDLQRLDLYEIVAPELTVLETPGKDGGPIYPAIGRLLADPRLNLRFEDGRLALRTTDLTYDLIEADALEPSMSYSGNLYSREFFELGRSRLAPGGILCTYVPTERTRRTILTVFPYVLDFHSPDFASLIIAADRPLHFDRRELLERLRSESVQGYLQAAGEREATTRLVERFLKQVEVTVIDDSNRASYMDGDVNTDLFPRDEFDKSYRGTYQ